MAEEISTTGKWVTAEGRVVESEPVEGRQLVAPGTPITPDIKASIDAAEAAAPVEAEPEPGEGKDEDDSAEKESAQPRKRAASK